VPGAAGVVVGDGSDGAAVAGVGAGQGGPPPPTTTTTTTTTTTIHPEHKLFIGMLPRSIEEGQVRDIFTSYGEIVEVFIIRDQNGNGRGCAFLKVRGDLPPRRRQLSSLLWTQRADGWGGA